MNITAKLSQIQAQLKAPKNQRNAFGGYNYRSCEDILEAVKPLLGEACLTISDDIVLIGDRFYIKATAKLSLGSEVIENSAFAREPLAKKGMDEAQITGATSSYARKYALNGLFAIDDTKDADATNTHGKEEKTDFEKTATAEKRANTMAVKKAINEGKDELPGRTAEKLKDDFTKTLQHLVNIKSWKNLNNTQIDFINRLLKELHDKGYDDEYEKLSTLYNKLQSEELADEIQF